MRWLDRLTVVVVAMMALVHCESLWDAAVAAAGKRASVEATNATLSRGAAEMRDSILAAVHSGDLADLKTAFELNEMRPDIADEPVEDPIAYWRTISKDGTGTDILAALGVILEMRPASVPLGRDIENNAIYVWPYLAERDPSSLTSGEAADLAKLASPDEVAAMRAAKRWTGWRLSIGADGVWHSFRREK